MHKYIHTHTHNLVRKFRLNTDNIIKMITKYENLVIQANESYTNKEKKP